MQARLFRATALSRDAFERGAPWVSPLFQVVMLLAWWVVLYGVVGEDALPGGNIFAIVAIFAASVPMGHAASMAGLPPLLGMLLVRAAGWLAGSRNRHS